MVWTMESNGTISQWRANDETDILFPETQLQLGDILKLRGGAPVCAPNFGTAPTDNRYRHAHLPKHGLVRLSRIENGEVIQGNPAIHQTLPALDEEGWITAGFYYTHPWPFDVWVSARSTSCDKDNVQHLEHRITLGTELIHDCDIPYSIGFHPYFATAGKTFSLHYGNRRWNTEDLDVDEPFYVPCRDEDKCFLIRTAHGNIEIELKCGYDGFYVWTDKPDKYICVEPVCVGYKPISHLILPAGGMADCKCTLRYTQTS